MRILITIIVSIAIGSASVIATIQNSTAESVKKESNSRISRDKRTLVDGNYATFNQYFGGGERPIQRRISTGYPEPRSYYPSSYNKGNFNQVSSQYDQYTQAGSLYNTNYITDQNYGHSQYLEAPEPIIEIIIKESNETLPLPQALQQPKKKKKKEEVQVFYVKYKKDEHKGLVIDDPIPALSPTQYHQNHQSNEEQEETEIVYQPTHAPLKTTTLRTIIHPDSEKYHSNSGVHVTFNTESKQQNGHQFQEHTEESALQPVISHDGLKRNFPQALTPNYHHGPPSYHQNHQFTSHFNEQHRGRYFDHPFQGPTQSHATPVGPHQQLPLQHTPSKPFRPDFRNGPPPEHYYRKEQSHPPPPPPQYNNNQQPTNRYFPNQQPFDIRPNNGQPQFPQNGPPKSVPPPFPPNGPPNGPQYAPQRQTVRFPPQPPSQPGPQTSQFPARHRPPNPSQPKPIPIPLQNAPQQSPSRPPFYNRPPQFSPSPPPNNPQQSDRLNSLQNAPQYRPKTESSTPSPYHQQLHFHQNNPQQQSQQNSQYQQTQHLEPSVRPFGNNNFAPQPQQQQHNFLPSQPFNGGLIQQTAPNLGPGTNLFQQNYKQSIQFNPNELIGNPANRIAPGAELLESVPRFEQHITETVPSSQANLPFGPRPIAQKVQQQPQHQSQPQQQSTPLQIVNSPQITQHQTQNSQQQNYQYFNQYQSQPNQQYQQQIFSQTPKQESESQSLHSENIQFAQSISISPLGNNFQDSTILDRNIHPQPHIIPNSAPIERKLVQGQSVSTLADEVFPNLEKEQLRYKPSQNDSEYVEISGRNRYSVNHSVSVTQKPSSIVSTYRPSTRLVSTPTTSRTTTVEEEEQTTTKAPKKKSQVVLPDEVPDDLREQLLSSGILDNADISVLDYDKLGDTALENLPPEHLANFYGAGGGSQISSSNKVVTIVRPNGEQVRNRQTSPEVNNAISSGEKTLPRKHNMDLKVVRFDSNSQKSVTDKYIRHDSTILPTVDLADQQYNRYLPLKVDGAQFPIPDAIELRGRKISSVVVLAPVDNLQSVEDNGAERHERDVIETRNIQFIAGDSLKQLLKKPTKENFKKWLDKEAKTDIDFQSVILLVTRNNKHDQEIYMYDIPTQKVSRLSGELSTAFVNVAEANANSQDMENASISDSGIVEQMARESNKSPDENTAAERFDSEAESSNTNERIFQIDGDEIDRNSGVDNQILITSGYSIIKN